MTCRNPENTPQATAPGATNDIATWEGMEPMSGVEPLTY